MKRCVLCHNSFPLEGFNKQANALDGRQSKCKPCDRRRALEYYNANKHKKRPRSTQPKYCPECNTSKPASEFASRSYSLDGLNPMCWLCSSAKRGEHYKKHREKYNKRTREYRSQNPEKHRVRRKLQYAVRSGALVRPLRCSLCKSTRCIEAHHADYSKPFEVEWLCARCHARIHAPERRRKSANTL